MRPWPVVLGLFGWQAAWGADVGLNGAICGYDSIEEALVDAVAGDTIYLEDGSTGSEGDFAIGVNVTVTTGGAQCAAAAPVAPATVDSGGGGLGAILIPAGVTVNFGEVLVRDHGGGFDDGGNFWVEGTLILTDTDVRDGAAHFGGGVYVADGGVLEMYERAAIEANGATLGGGVYVEEGGEVRMFDSSRIAENNADFGGGLYSYGLIELEDGAVEIEDNLVTGDGGGVYLVGSVSGTLLDIFDAAIRDNQADGSGAGIYAFDTPGKTTRIELVEGYIDGNDAQVDGGGIWSLGEVFLGVESSVRFNTAVGNGGGVYGGGLVELIESQIIENTASGDGGGVYFPDGGTLVVENTPIDWNVAGNDGAGLWLAGATVARIDGALISDNVAANDGGGLYLTGPVDVELRGTWIHSNVAGGDGGGILVGADTASVPLLHLDGPRDPVTGACTFEFTAPGANEYCSELRQNTATRGGGLFARDGVIDIDRTAFVGNDATTDGLAVNLIDDDNPVLTMINVLVVGHPGTAGQNVLRAGNNTTLDARQVTVAANAGGVTAVRYVAGSSGQFVRGIIWNGDFAVATAAALTATCTSYDTLSVGVLAGGNIAPGQNPGFVNTADGFYRLGFFSPGRNVCGAGNVVDLMSDSRVLPASRGAFE